MALVQDSRNGVFYIAGSSQDIQDTATARELVVGRLYINTDTNTMGRAYPDGGTGSASKTTLIKWEVNASWVTSSIATAVDAEATARTNADSALVGLISAEVTARQAGDTTNANAISAEVIRATAKENLMQSYIDQEVSDRQSGDIALGLRIDGEATARQAGDDAIDTAYKAADAALQTTLTANLTNAVNALRDERVTDFVGVDYTGGQTISLPSILLHKGSETTLRDGIHLFKFNSTDILNVGTLTGLPSGTADMSISYNDIVKVVVDGGVAVSAVLIDDVLKAKLDALDSAISALNAATTPSAIRSHFSATGFATYANGVFDASLSAGVGQDLKISILDNKPYFSLKSTNLQFVNQTGNNDDGTVEYIINNIFAQLGGLQSAPTGVESGLHVDQATGKGRFGGALLENATVTGAYKVQFDNTAVGAKLLELQSYQATRNASGYITGRGASLSNPGVLWLTEEGDLMIDYVPN